MTPTKICNGCYARFNPTEGHFCLPVGVFLGPDDKTPLTAPQTDEEFSDELNEGLQRLMPDGTMSPPGSDFPPPAVTPSASNPKTLTGRRKLPMLSVIPPASLIYEALAMRYGAFEAPRVDGTKGYGPFNWREQPIEAMVYLDAALRHLLAFVDGEDFAEDSLVHHLGHTKATIGILIDAIENGTCIDDRPAIRSKVATRLLDAAKRG